MTTVLSTVVVYLRRHHLAALALFLSVGGGSSYAAVSAVSTTTKVYVCAAPSKSLTLSSATGKCKAKKARKLTLSRPVVSPGGTGAGAPGTPGPKGDSGAPGVKGETGPTGTANVITSDWFTAPAPADITEDNTVYNATSVNVPALTASVIATADIHVYFTFGANIYPLPYTSFAGGHESTISFAVSPGQISIRRFTGDNSGLVALSNSLLYRYVIIPRGAVGAPGTA